MKKQKVLFILRIMKEKRYLKESRSEWNILAINKFRVEKGCKEK